MTTEAPPEQTPEELEKEAQAQDLEDAKVAAEASVEAMEALAEPWSNVRRHRGVGPLVIKTRRGEIKAFSGDIIVTFTPKAPTPPPEETDEQKAERLARADELVFTEEQFVELAGVAVEDLPEDLMYRAVALGEARRKAAAEPPVAPPAEPPATPPVATGATAGTPGTYTPSGAATPANLSAFNTIVASPSTPWTTGQYVPYGAASKAYWNGTAWATGQAS